MIPPIPVSVERELLLRGCLGNRILPKSKDEYSFVVVLCFFQVPPRVYKSYMADRLCRDDSVKGFEIRNYPRLSGSQCHQCHHRRDRRVWFKERQCRAGSRRTHGKVLISQLRCKKSLEAGTPLEPPEGLQPSYPVHTVRFQDCFCPKLLTLTICSTVVHCGTARLS